MARKWTDVELNPKWFTNVDSACLTRGAEAMENLFVNETGGQSRFPGLSTFATLAGNQPTYLYEWRNDLIAVTGGRVYRMDAYGNVEDVTDVQVSGGRRVVFDRTPNELVMTAGAEPIRFAGRRTEILSADAPLSTHIAFVDGYLLAIERGSGRFQHSDVDGYRVWNPLNFFSANGKPDDLNAMQVTPFRELILTGLDSIEQFERLANAETPFFRRWSVGEGVFAPYTLTYGDNASWYVNKKKEWVRSSGQTSVSQGDDIGRSLEKIDNWEDAWAQEVAIVGQKFFVIQAPKATNVYGTQGVTLLFDYRQKRWMSLYGWNASTGIPERWPGWSYYPLWKRHFVGGNGKVLELDSNVFQNDGVTQRVLFRTGHISKFGESSVDNLRIRVKRGVGSYTEDPQIGIRAIRNNNQPTRVRRKGLGKSGDSAMMIEFGGYGWAHTWQFEIDMTDAAQYEVVSMQVLLQKGGH